MVPTALHERLLVAVGDRTFRHIGELTKTHPETVRRYMGGQSPSTDFLAALCTNLSLNADWLLTGRGAMKLDEQRSQALREATAADLFTAMAQTIEQLMDRVSRLETFVQTMETRVRGRARPAAGEITPKDTERPKAMNLAKEVNHAAAPTPVAHAGADAPGQGAPGQDAPAPAPQRVQRLQSVLAQRSRPDAG